MKILTVISIIFIIVGLAIGFIALCLADFDFTGFEELTEENFTITEEINGIDIAAAKANCNITLRSSDSDNAELTFVYKKGSSLSYTVADGRLSITGNKNHLLSFIDFNVDNHVILTLPKKIYGTLTADCSTGDVSVSGLEFSEAVNIKVSTGNIAIENAKAKTLAADISTGDISMANVEVTERLSLSSSTGEIRIENSSVATVEEIKTSTGKVKLKNVSAAGSVNVKTSTGDTVIEGSVFGGNLTVNGRTGDLKMTDSDAGEIEINLSTGKVTLSLLSPKNFVADSSSGEVSVTGSVYTAPMCKIKTSTGDITVTVSPKK